MKMQATTLTSHNTQPNKISRLAIFLLTAGAMATPSCAGMMQAWRQAHCNYDGAYKLGMNEAREGKEMSSAIAMHCPAEGKAEAQRGYREGYTIGATNDTAASTVAADGPAYLARGRWQCKSAYGQKACGYSCVAAYGTVACASQPQHNCVEAYGQVRCGQNCRADYGQIQCD